MLCSDFSDVIDLLKNISDEEKQTVSIRLTEDESVDIMMVVDDQETVIFSAEMKNFVWAFFILFGINIDENMEAASC
jgi:hypothetical protein